MMISKERVLAALAFQEPDRLPFNFWMDRRLMAQYEAKFGPQFRVTHYGADCLEAFPAMAWPSGEHVYRDGTAWLVKPLLDSISEADSLMLPDGDDPEVAVSVRQAVEEFPEVAIFADVAGPLTLLSGVRGYENLFTDFYDDPEAMKRVLWRIRDILAAAARHLCDAGITALYLMDDIADRNGLMLSKEMLEEFFFPVLEPAAEVARARGIPVLFHSDGKVEPILDRLIEMGVSAVNPLQPHLNDLSEFKRKYHGRLAVYGTGDNTYIIPQGSPEQVAAHVRECFETAGRGGGMIYSTHDIPLETPPENIKALVAELHACKYGGK